MRSVALADVRPRLDAALNIPLSVLFLCTGPQTGVAAPRQGAPAEDMCSYRSSRGSLQRAGCMGTPAYSRKDRTADLSVMVQGQTTQACWQPGTQTTQCQPGMQQQSDTLSDRAFDFEIEALSCFICHACAERLCLRFARINISLIAEALVASLARL